MIDFGKEVYPYLEALFTNRDYGTGGSEWVIKFKGVSRKQTRSIGIGGGGSVKIFIREGW